MSNQERKKNQWERHNWKTLEAGLLNKLHPLQRSRYLAYEEPSRNIQEAQESVKKRLRDHYMASKSASQAVAVDDEELDEVQKREKLIGQLKAAEARNRIRIMRLRFEANKDQEVNHLISCQSTASKAVRLQALLPLKDKKKKRPFYDKLQKTKVEQLLEDTGGLLTIRT